MIPGWSSTARRLALGFGAVVVLFALAAGFALAGLDRIQRSVRVIRDQEQAVRLSLELTSAVRDQYAHQAHTIIIGDDSHLAYYAAAEEKVLRQTERVRERATTAAQRAAVEAIDRASAELGVIFRQRIVPAVLRGDAATVREEHGQAQVVVTRIQDLAAGLVAAFEADIDRARADADAVERRTFAWILALLVGSPLLALLVSLSIVRSVTGPLAQLSVGAARLGQGDLATRIDPGGPDEFGALARQFNAMAGSLERHQAQLVESEKLAGLGRLAAGVAHELNNPLGVILGYVHLLRRTAAGSMDADLAIIEHETNLASEIVAGLLELSRPLPPGRGTVALRLLCDEVVARLRDSGGLAGASAAVEGEASTDGHAGKLRQLVANLVRNAAQAAGAGGRVEVRLSEAGGAARLEVRDSGPGVPSEIRGRLFEPFFTTRPDGTGLGLAVSRAIARAHGGDVVVADAPGGACFTVTLPGPGRGEA